MSETTKGKQVGVVGDSSRPNNEGTLDTSRRIARMPILPGVPYEGPQGKVALDTRNAITHLIDGTEDKETTGPEIEMTAFRDLKSSGKGKVLSTLRIVSIKRQGARLIISRYETQPFERALNDVSIPASIQISKENGITLSMKTQKEAIDASQKLQRLAEDDSGSRTACERIFTLESRTDASEKGFVGPEVTLRKDLGLSQN
jgi:hypothetical protein